MRLFEGGDSRQPLVQLQKFCLHAGVSQGLELQALAPELIEYQYPTEGQQHGDYQPCLESPDRSQAPTLAPGQQVHSQHQRSPPIASPQAMAMDAHARVKASASGKAARSSPGSGSTTWVAMPR
ncbi:MAG: hypothetical protein K0S77_155 [Pseudomonas sp.]|nr:hypothetical protein [Pseudomonas sp.]